MRFDRGDIYQLLLTGLAVVALFMVGIFVYRELFPEYKEYQNTYVNLEEFRSSLSGEPVPPFKGGIKQIVMAKVDKGPEDIDRCVSCHVALKFEHFSDQKIAYDLNGNMITDEEGHPFLTDNEHYVWKQLEDRIALLTDEGTSEALSEAEELKKLLDGPHDYDMKKALSMHPLIGRESRPFEYHSMEDFGCTSCHNGNGNSVVTERAHGPVIDGQYHASHEGHKMVFTELDPDNDPKMATVFNSKPSHGLLFQTTPLFVGPLMQAKCVQCHQSGKEEFKRAVDAVDIVVSRKSRQVDSITQGIKEDTFALLALMETHRYVKERGYQKALESYESSRKNESLTDEEHKQVNSRLAYLTSAYEKLGKDENKLIAHFEKDMTYVLGSEKLVQNLLRFSKGRNLAQDIEIFLDEHKSDVGSQHGRIFKKMRSLNERYAAKKHAERIQEPLLRAMSESGLESDLATDTDSMLGSYLRGKELYVNSGCYACHRIDGLSRGQVGPDLTKIGRYYPWYIKEAIVWPQSNLKTSTMPNFKFDHEEVEDLVTFLLAQQESDRGESEVQQKIMIKEWEAGKKLAWEKPIAPAELKDTKKSMLVFASEGCASCHRLKGFESAVNYRIANASASFKGIYRETEWFRDLFPERILGSQIVRAIDSSGAEIDRHIMDDAREKGILEEIEKIHPRLLPSFYSEFKYAMRAKNKHFDNLIELAEDEETRNWQMKERDLYLARVRRVMMMYIQEYGLGRDVAPRLHWSAAYRDTEWLIGHFKKPSAYVAKSIMPPLPFDDSKFYALTYMLQTLAEKNRIYTRELWDNRGFDPELAYEMHCVQCHGEEAHGNGTVAQWIYPVPKNLKDPTFMRNLTRERAIYSIEHGVLGTPMPPWGEVVAGNHEPVLKHAEVEQLVDWLYLSVPGGRVIRGDEDVPKWQYQPEDVLREMINEGDHLQGVKKVKPVEILQSGFIPFFGATMHGILDGGEQTVSDLFDEVEHADNVDGKAYYIKKEFYTAKNLAEGQALFIQNCSHCHGKEAEGSGARSVTMEQAKPRMLTNLPWLKTRDDLRLLRSIKYGVQGTAMTTWGDKTSTLQRIQMLMFIRSLSSERDLRDHLFLSLYQTFGTAEESVEVVRSYEGSALADIKMQYERTISRREELYQGVKEGDSTSHMLSKTYAKELSLLDSLKLREELDGILADLLLEIRKERTIYEEIGLEFISKKMSDALMAKLNRYIEANANRYLIQDKRLVMTGNGNAESDQKKLQEEMLQEMKMTEEAFIQKEHVLSGKIASPERNEELENVSYRLSSVKAARAALLSRLRVLKRVEQAQREKYNQYKEKISVF